MLVGKILDKRYVVLESIGDDGAAHRYLVYDMNGLRRTQVRVVDKGEDAYSAEEVDPDLPLEPPPTKPKPKLAAVATPTETKQPEEPKVDRTPLPDRAKKPSSSEVAAKMPTAAPEVKNAPVEAPAEKPAKVEAPVEVAATEEERKDTTQPIALESLEEIADDPGFRRRVNTRDVETAWFAQGDELEDDSHRSDEWPQPAVTTERLSELRAQAENLPDDAYKRFALDLAPPRPPPPAVEPPASVEPPPPVTPVAPPVVAPPVIEAPVAPPPVVAPPVVAAPVVPAPVVEPPAPVAPAIEKVITGPTAPPPATVEAPPAIQPPTAAAAPIAPAPAPPPAPIAAPPVTPIATFAQNQTALAMKKPSLFQKATKPQVLLAGLLVGLAGGVAIGLAIGGKAEPAAKPEVAVEKQAQAPTEEPKAEEPKAEEPKAEEPKAEEPKPEETLTQPVKPRQLSKAQRRRLNTWVRQARKAAGKRQWRRAQRYATLALKLQPSHSRASAIKARATAKLRR